MTSSIRDWPKLISQAYEYVVLSFVLLSLFPSTFALPILPALPLWGEELANQDSHTDNYRALKPGGWIELQELRFVASCDDGTLPPQSYVVKFLQGVKDGLAAFGVDLLGMQKNQENVKAAGFVSVDEQAFKVPIGSWPRNQKMKTIGTYNRSMIYDGLQGISMGPFTRGLKWSPQEVEVFLVDVRKALLDRSQHSYLPFHVVIGQKPHSTSS